VCLVFSSCSLFGYPVNQVLINSNFNALTGSQTFYLELRLTLLKRRKLITNFKCYITRAQFSK
jgi:hypothetical protein